MVNIDKITLDSWINKENISYIEIGRRLDCSIAYIKKYATKLGISLPIRNNRKTESWNKGKGIKVYCKNCGKLLNTSNGVHKQFCSSKCSGEYRKESKYKNYLENQKDFIGNEISYKWLKPHILKEQDAKCAICKMPTTWNNKELHFILDHIDGDATNNTRSNLRLICPNCDSQLDTYKSRNIGNSTRKYKPHKL